ELVGQPHGLGAGDLASRWSQRWRFGRLIRRDALSHLLNSTEARRPVAPPFLAPLPGKAISMPSFKFRSSFARVFGLLTLAVALVGCGGVKKITVNGTVSYKGQKLSSGILKFIGPGGAYSAAQINSDGTYIMTDVVPGDV